MGFNDVKGWSIEFCFHSVDSKHPHTHSGLQMPLFSNTNRSGPCTRMTLEHQNVQKA